MSERRDLEGLFELAIEAAPSGMVLVDHDGSIMLVNGEAERLFGYSRRDLIGRNVDMLVPLASRREHAGMRADFARSPTRRSMGAGRDLYGRRRDGSSVPIEVGLTPVDTAGRSMVLAVVIDISERKQAEEELRRSNAELEQFAYVASHDLQEPLRMVASYTELLQRRYEGQLDERADKYIRYAVDGAKRMQQLISDLLRFSRLSTQAEPRTETDVRELVARVVNTSLAAQVRETGGAVEIGELPTVLADTRQLEQVFQNLISNGLKFHAEDRSPLVRIDAARRDADWLFTIRDNGIGIGQEHAERVFEMFQRLHPVGRYAGSGIGLTLVKKIVARHGGRVWFESEPGRGTAFCFTLPLEPEAQ